MIIKLPVASLYELTTLTTSIPTGMIFHGTIKPMVGPVTGFFLKTICSLVCLETYKDYRVGQVENYIPFEKSELRISKCGLDG